VCADFKIPGPKKFSPLRSSNYPSFLKSGSQFPCLILIQELYRSTTGLQILIAWHGLIVDATSIPLVPAQNGQWRFRNVLTKQAHCEKISTPA
jgi:hypothetical protein